MIPEPLHPAIVHFPIVFAVILPIVALIGLVLIRRGTPPRAAWIWVVVLSAALAGSSWLAVETGEDQEELVEDVVPESAIHEHEEAAERFRILSGLAVLVLGAGLINTQVGEVARPVGAAGAILLLLFGLQVGSSGGKLVYEYGAAEAYVEQGQLGATPGSPGKSVRNHEDEEEDHDENEERGERH